jgi:hypothetical protein
MNAKSVVVLEYNTPPPLNFPRFFVHTPQKPRPCMIPYAASSSSHSRIFWWTASAISSTISIGISTAGLPRPSRSFEHLQYGHQHAVMPREVLSCADWHGESWALAGSERAPLAPNSPRWQARWWQARSSFCNRCNRDLWVPRRVPQQVTRRLSGRVAAGCGVANKTHPAKAASFSAVSSGVAAAACRRDRAALARRYPAITQCTLLLSLWGGRSILSPGRLVHGAKADVVVDLHGPG